MTSHTLILSEEEREALASVLESVLSNLSYEIADTDLHDFKESLKHRRELLRSVSGKLTDAGSA